MQKAQNHDNYFKIPCDVGNGAIFQIDSNFLFLFFRFTHADCGVGFLWSLAQRLNIARAAISNANSKNSRMVRIEKPM